MSTSQHDCPFCDILNGDMDGNTTVDVLDVAGFVNRLMAGG